MVEFKSNFVEGCLKFKNKIWNLLELELTKRLL